MSLIRSISQINRSLMQCSLLRRINPVRGYQTDNSNASKSTDIENNVLADDNKEESLNTSSVAPNTLNDNQYVDAVFRRGDKYTIIPIETCIEYMRSSAYKTTYGDKPVWAEYRRNFKGTRPPSKTRKTCIRNGEYTTSNPCPICRDVYLRFHYTNVDLLKQFISEYDGQVISYTKTGICQVNHKRLLISVLIAKDHGLFAFEVPFRSYKYSEWYDFPSENRKSFE